MECPSTQEMIFLNSMVEKSFHVSETVLDEGRNISDKWLAADKRIEV